MPRKKPGRPPKKKSELRTNTLQVMLSVAERKELNAYAEENDVELSRWAREKLLSFVRRSRAQR